MSDTELEVPSWVFGIVLRSHHGPADLSNSDNRELSANIYMRYPLLGLFLVILLSGRLQPAGDGISEAKVFYQRIIRISVLV